MNDELDTSTAPNNTTGQQTTQQQEQGNQSGGTSVQQANGSQQAASTSADNNQQNNSASIWPDKWRETYVQSRNGDDKLLNRLNRYSDPQAALDALISVQNKISAGELRTNNPYPQKGTPEQQAEWRRIAGIPESSDKYELKLSDGLVVGEEDRPVIDSFLKQAHEKNMSPEQVSAVVDWYYKDLERAKADLAQRDQEIANQLEDTLRQEWGNDYRKNKTIIEAFLDSGPEGTKNAVFESRLADGTPLMSDINVLRWLANAAREANPTIGLVPGEGAGQVKALDDEIADLTRASAAPKGTPEHQKYWKGGGSDRLHELLQAKERLASRK